MSSVTPHPLDVLEIFGPWADHAVVPAGLPWQLEGRGAPGNTLDLVWAGETHMAAMDADGHWSCTLPAPVLGRAYRLEIHCQGGVRILDNLVGGRLILGAGQSNMQISLARTRFASPEALEAPVPGLRFAVVPERPVFAGAERSLPGLVWREASGEALRDFPALAFFAARLLVERGLGPLGVIVCALGGSPLEAWLSEEEVADWRPERARAWAAWTPEAIAATEAANRHRLATWEAALPPLPADPEVWAVTRDWVPRANHRLPQEAGVYWYRRPVILDEATVGDGGGFLDLGTIKDADQTWVNGVLVGQTPYQYPPRWYTIPPGTLHPGENQILVRVVAEGPGSGFQPGKRVRLIPGTQGLRMGGGLVSGPGNRPILDLEGSDKAGDCWSVHRETTLAPREPEVFLRWEPTVLWRGMMAALEGIPFQAMVWYQGESDTQRPEGYGDGLRALLGRWVRDLAPGGAVYVVQLPRFRGDDGGREQWAVLRDQQAHAVDAEPRAVLVPALDLGEWNDIHPVDKEALGRRLGLAMLRHSFSVVDGAWSGRVIPPPQWTAEKGHRVLAWAPGTRVEATDGASWISLRFLGPGLLAGPCFLATLEDGYRLVVPPEFPVSPDQRVAYGWANHPDGPFLVGPDGLPLRPFVTEPAP